MTYEAQRWTLKDLLPPAESDEMAAHIEDIKARLEAFEGLRDKLSPEISEEEFLEILHRYEELYADASVLRAYSYLWFSEDTTAQAALTFRARTDQLVAEMQNSTLFFTLWWKSLDEENAERLMANSGDLRYFLESLRRFTPYTLSEPEERLINIKDVNGVNAVLTVYDMITNDFKFHLTVDGEEKELTRSELSTYVMNPSADLRAAAYQEMYRVYAEQTPVFAQIYAARVRDWTEENVKLRDFDSPISVRNLDNNIPDPVVDTMLDVVQKNAPLFQRFFRFKAQALGVDRLRRYDVYAPLSQAEREYTFDQAVNMIDESYRDFSPTLADRALRVLEEQHLDAEVRPRKMGGAYCYSTRPDLTPWVLTHFTGKIQAVSTLAHELGHAVHAMMAEEHSVLTFHAPLPLAETASVFGEMLLTDKLLSEEKDPAVRRTLISTLLDDAYATIPRQAYFVLFEKTAHQMILDGATTDDLNAAYMENLTSQFGDAVKLSDEFRLEWTLIPHIYHTPFYCYAYAFGNLLVLALYRKYKELGREAFEPDYLRVLSYGGSASPDHIISEAGFDMASPEFWQGGFDLLEEMLEDLEKLG
jgi:oligoendopeptidase F